MSFFGVVVRIGDLVIRERRGSSSAAQSAGLVASQAWGNARFPEMAIVDPDNVDALRTLWSTVQCEEPRSVLAPWFVHTCHGRVGSVHASELRGNLVVRYQWEANRPAVFSLFGTQDLEQSTLDALAGIAAMGQDPVLHQVSERQADILRHASRLRLERERERDEYVLDTESHAALEGHAYKRMRYAIRHFVDQWSDVHIRMLDAMDPDHLTLLANSLSAMPNSSHMTGNDGGDWEEACLREFLRRPIGSPIQIFAIEIDRHVRGIGIFELAIDHRAVVFHVLRTDAQFDGLVEFGIWALARACARQGIAELNLEEDLGLAGLRRKKEHLHPARMITHYRLHAS